jgi:hypothetical protein
MNCPNCNAPLKHQLSVHSIQYACGTTVNINTYHVGPDAIKVQGLITGKCADKISIKMGVKE